MLKGNPVPQCAKKSCVVTILPVSSNSTPSISSRALFIVRPPWNPPSLLSERMARWKGMIRGKGFRARALPTALAPPTLPRCRAMSR